MDDIVEQLRATNVTETDRNITAVGDIVDRLRDHELLEVWGVEVFLLAIAAADEIERLRSVIDTLLDAINNAGPVPKHHIQVASKHRKEWPTLWKAIDQLREARHG